jgi:hypothetical protein
MIRRNPGPAGMHSGYLGFGLHHAVFGNNVDHAVRLVEAGASIGTTTEMHAAHWPRAAALRFSKALLAAPRYAN